MRGVIFIIIITKNALKYKTTSHGHNYSLKNTWSKLCFLKMQIACPNPHPQAYADYFRIILCALTQVRQPP
ncbi:hypothetical protein WN943_015678 [Citrus x changshan-huyou]